MAMLFLLSIMFILPSNSLFPLVLVSVSAWSPPIPRTRTSSSSRKNEHHHPAQWQRQHGITTAPLFMKEPNLQSHSPKLNQQQQHEHATVSQTQSMAMLPKAAKKSKNKRRRRFEDLFEKLPRSTNAICSNSMVHDLDLSSKALLREYIIERCPGSAEIADALFWVAETHPKELRTKELIETMEAMTLIGGAINVLLDDNTNASGSSGSDNTHVRNKESMTIYDLACGHGLGGMLLAYRFPQTKVVCIDMERRPCWNTYIEAFEKFGTKALPGSNNDTTVMANLAFEVGDIMTNTTTFKPSRGDYLMCIHGCNDLSPFVLTTALQYNTGYAVMPCCIRDGSLLGGSGSGSSVSSSSSGRNGGITDDKSRYALQVGFLAGKFGCSRVAAISHVITNRFLIVIGDYWTSK